MYNEKYKKSKSSGIASSAEQSLSVSYERKTAKPFFNSRLPIRLRAVRDLQRARSAKFPAQQSLSVSDKRKTPQAFFASRLPIRFRAVVVCGFSTTAFCVAKCAAAMQRCDTASVPCNAKYAALCVLIRNYTGRCGVSPQRGKQKRPERLSARTLKRGGDFPLCVRRFVKRDLENVLTKWRYAGTILYRFKIRNVFYDNY